MKDVFELDVSTISGPSPRGSLHAAVSLELNPNSGFIPDPPAAPVAIEPVAERVPLRARPLKPKPLVSFVVSTFNRRDVLLKTLEEVNRCGLKSEEFETLVVDNASTDGTSAALRKSHPMIYLLQQEYNGGPVSKNLAIRSARGRYVIFLDDDSYPMPGAVARMMKHFEADPTLGAAVFTITLPNGARECSAYPNVFIGCGTGFRRTALEQVGGLPEDFFMQAEEYDLSLRLLAAGFEIQTFDDLHVTHLKSPTARASERVTQFDVRNNLVLITRYFPLKWVLPFAKDWLRRYRLIALAKGHELAYYKGLIGGLWRTLRPSNRRPVDEATFEKLVKLNETEVRLARAVEEHDLKRVLFIDFGKNMLPYYLAAKKCGLEIVAIADERLSAGEGTRGEEVDDGGIRIVRGSKRAAERQYRGIPILKDAACRGLSFDAAIVSNLSPVHAAQRRNAWRIPGGGATRLVIDLFEDDRYASVTFADRASRGFPQTVARSA
jgi:GT2 family glycosyltransferase